MNEEISIRAKYSVDDYVKALTYMQRQLFINKYNFLIAFVGIFALTALLTLFLANDKSSIKFFPVIFSALLPATIVGGLIFFLNRVVNPFILKRSISKQYKSSPAMQEENNIVFSIEGIKTTTNLASSTLKWEAIVKALESETEFLFYTSNKFAHFIPKSIFASEIDVSSVRSLTRAKLGDKAKF